MPEAVEPAHLLALLTRVRAVRVGAGELASERLYDVRAFKCCYAELGYLRRLAAAGRAGGTVVTSMRQLVAGLAALHPAWRIDGGEGFEDRDRHHRAVRRRLDALQAMGLLRWRIGTDMDGEERRTELELRPAPELSAEELHAATGRLKRWQARYGPALNTGSKTGIRNAAGHGRPLSPAERHRRGCQQTRARAAAARGRRGGDLSNSTPPSGAPATPENNPSVNPNASESRNACHRPGVTRAQGDGQPTARPAPDAPTTTTGSEEGRVPGPQGDGRAPDGAVGAGAAAASAVWDLGAIVARVAERERELRPVLEAIARQACERALVTAGWGLERSWPAWRLREAWVVARYGELAAANAGAAGAGPISGEDYARLRRAIARYEHNQTARPHGYPAGGLAGLLYLAALTGAGELAHGPRSLRYAIGALDQLSRRMRAVATADSAQRAQHASQRAQRRHDPAPRAQQLSFRSSRWPAWVATDPDGNPVFDQLGMLELDYGARGGVPAADSEQYRMTIRDAYLIAGRPLPVDVDGRKQMALRHQRQLDRPPRRSPASAQQRELAELAHRTAEPLSVLARLSPAYRQAWLAQLRRDDAERARREILAFNAQIANLTPDVQRQ